MRSIVFDDEFKVDCSDPEISLVDFAKFAERQYEFWKQMRERENADSRTV